METLLETAQDQVSPYPSRCYNMQVFCLKYEEPIDAITADKVVKLQQYQLDPKDCTVVEDLVSVLKVSTLAFCST